MQRSIDLRRYHAQDCSHSGRAEASWDLFPGNRRRWIGLRFRTSAGNPATNELEFGDIKSQVRRTLRNVDLVLEAAGSSLRHSLKLGVYLADLNDFAAMNEVFQEFFPDEPPARTTVGSQLPKVKVEIDCIARVRKTRLKRDKA